MMHKYLTSIAATAVGVLLADGLIRLGSQLADYRVNRRILADLEREHVLWLESLGTDESGEPDWDTHLAKILDGWAKEGEQ